MKRAVILSVLLAAACSAELSEIPIGNEGKEDRSELAVTLSDEPIAFGFDCAEDCGVSVQISAKGDGVVELGKVRIEADGGEREFPMTLTDGKLRLPTQLLNRGIGEGVAHVRILLEKAETAPETKVTLGVSFRGRIAFVEGAWPHLVTSGALPWSQHDPFPRGANELNGDADFEVSGFKTGNKRLSLLFVSSTTTPRPKDTWVRRWVSIGKQLDTGVVDAMVSDMDCQPHPDFPGGSTCLTRTQIRSQGCTIDLDPGIFGFDQVTGTITCPPELGLASPTFRFRSWAPVND